MAYLFTYLAMSFRTQNFIILKKSNKSTFYFLDNTFCAVFLKGLKTLLLNALLYGNILGSEICFDNNTVIPAFFSLVLKDKTFLHFPLKIFFINKTKRQLSEWDKRQLSEWDKISSNKASNRD